MSYSYSDITDIIKSQKTFLQKKYGLKQIGIFNYYKEAGTTDFIVGFNSSMGIKFIDFCEFIESILNIDAQIITIEGLENIKDESLKNGIKSKIEYV